MNPNNANETISDIFPWHMFKSDVIFFYQKISKYFNDFGNLNFAVTKVNPSNRNKKKNQTYFHGEDSNQTSFPLVAILNTKIFQ